MSKILTPNRVALLLAGLLDIAAFCTAAAGAFPKGAGAILAVGAIASAAAKAVTFAVGSWKHAQLQADISVDPATDPAIAAATDLPSDDDEQAAPPPGDVTVTEPAPQIEDPPRAGPPVQPSQAGIVEPGA